ncbi:MAG: response regulator [Candidatus Omnitrophica bacterium]|nr:response regulator [Candidatus Omnitrophota bacterium]
MQTYKILLVDDEEMILTALVRTLRSKEYHFFTAPSAEEALEIINREKIDLVISDYKMGEVNGLQLLEEISEVSPDTLNILLTGNADIHMAIDAVNKAVLYKFILKPWDNEELKISIKRALEQKDLLTQNTFLANELQKRDKVISDLENQYPGISDVDADPSGNIILNLNNDNQVDDSSSP